jgi:hypothetical protein
MARYVLWQLLVEKLAMKISSVKTENTVLIAPDKMKINGQNN